MMMMMIIKYDNNIIKYVRTPARRALPLALSHTRMPLAHPHTPAAAHRPAPHHAAPRAARPHHTTVLDSSMRTAYHTDTLVSLAIMGFVLLFVVVICMTAAVVGSWW